MWGKKPAPKPVVEMGTQQNTDIDYDWLPKETTTEFGMFCSSVVVYLLL